MDIITLLPGDKRLSQLIKIHGNQWGVQRIGNPQCLNDAGALIVSKDGRHQRWVEIKDIEYPPVELDPLPENLTIYTKKD